MDISPEAVDNVGYEIKNKNKKKKNYSFFHVDEIARIARTANYVPFREITHFEGKRHQKSKKDFNCQQKHL